MSEQTMAYAGLCAECGGMCAATVDDAVNKKNVRKDVADFMKSGMTIERVTVAHVNQNLRGHLDGCSIGAANKRRRERRTPAEAQLVNTHAADSTEGRDQ